MNIVTAALTAVTAWINNYGTPEAQRRRRFKRYAKKTDKQFKKVQGILDDKDSKALRATIDNLLNRRM